MNGIIPSSIKASGREEFERCARGLKRERNIKVRITQLNLMILIKTNAFTQ
jgi:hypothetical protein